MRLASCDAAVFLDYPRHLCAWRVLKRAMFYRGVTRPDLAPGCREKIDLPFLKWVWDFPTRSRPRVLERLGEVADRVSIFRVQTDREADELLDSLAAGEMPKNGRT